MSFWNPDFESSLITYYLACLFTFSSDNLVVILAVFRLKGARLTCLNNYDVGLSMASLVGRGCL